jgi:hypothetical protein
MTARAKIAARLTGTAVGLAVAAGFTASGLMPEDRASTGARLTMLAQSTGELLVEPRNRFLSASNLEPRGSRGGVRGAITVTNQTGSTLAARTRVVSAANDLDDLLHVEVSAGPTPIFEGYLGQLRDWTEQSFRLRSGERMEVEVRAWIRSSVTSGYQARSADLTLVFRTRAVGHRWPPRHPA